VVGIKGFFVAPTLFVVRVGRLGCFAAAALTGRAGALPEVFFKILPAVLLLAVARGFTLTALGRAADLVFTAAPATRELFFVDFAGKETTVLFFVALRTGAFSAPERLASGFGGRAVVLALNLRFFADDALAALRATGREEGLFALLLTDSLMRNSHYQNDSRNRSQETPAA
ncbi:MAG: hypothetical protein LC747_01560, partial [Acidobacteria bacterium]|nr:hypothetical protein [Acidobacteriota bacterium]